MVLEYSLMHKDTELVKFNVIDGIETKYEIKWINKKEKNLLPYDFEVSSEGIEKFLRRRNIPKNRAYVHNFLSKCGLSLNKPMDIIKVSKGLSLNDCYWIKETNDNIRFSTINLYDNNFSRVLALLAFTGYRFF